MQSFDLTSEQQVAYCHIGAANNTFLAGRPGTGKSYLLKRVREEHGYDGGTIFVAPTGIVARALKCPTIHSFFELPCEPLMATEASPLQKCLWRLRAAPMQPADGIAPPGGMADPILWPRRERETGNPTCRVGLAVPAGRRLRHHHPQGAGHDLGRVHFDVMPAGGVPQRLKSMGF